MGIRIAYSYILSFIRRIKNAIRAFKFYWSINESNNDYVEILLIIKFKLDNIRKNLESHKSYEYIDKDKYIKSLRICSKLMTRIINQNYITNDLSKLDKIYGPCILKTLENGYTSIEGSNIRTREEREAYAVHLIEILNLEDRMMIRDQDRLFKVMNKYIRTWWV